MEVKSDQIEQDLHADKSLALTQKSNNKTLYLDSIRAFQEGDTFNGNRYLDAAKAEDPNSFLTILTLSNLAHSGKKSLAAFEFYSHVFGLITKINSAKHCDIFLSSLKFFIQATDSIHPSFIPHARNYGELYLNRLTEDEFTELLKKISELLTTSDYERISGRTVFYIFELLNYHRQGRRDFLHLTFSSFVVPLIERLLQYKNYFTALETEKYVYNNHVKTIETSECFRFVYGKLAPLMHAAGEALPEVKSRRKKNSDHPPKIAFVLHNGSLLAHVQLLLATLRPLKTISRQPFIPEIFVLGPIEKPMQEAFDEIDVKVNWIGMSDKNIFDMLKTMKKEFEAHPIDALVWISVALYMPFAFGMRLARKQIWWAMKYHSINLPTIDGYVTGYSISRQKIIDGKSWRTSCYGVKDWFDPNVTQQALRIKKEFGAGKTILGSFGREEKLNNKNFIESVCNILIRNQNTIFLWTGREELQSIKNIFVEHGVAPRCHFIGWINTKIYAQVIDIFLDSYPFPCGYTAFEAMAAAKPIVFYDSAEAYETGINGMIKPALDGETGSRQEVTRIQEIFDNGKLYPLAKLSSEYTDFANKLIEDMAFRSSVGVANKLFIDNFLSDENGMAQGYWSHFLEIIDG